MPVTIADENKEVRLSTRGGNWHLLRALAAQSSRPDVLACTLTRPHEDSLRAALLAWSYAEWVNYAGLAYVTSPGAAIVRRVILDGTAGVPQAAVVYKGAAAGSPLGKPQPVLVVRAERPVNTLEDVAEFLGLGVSWGGRMVAILPAASDAAGEVYSRLEGLAGTGQITYFSVPDVLAGIASGRLERGLRFTDDAREVRFEVTRTLDGDEIASLSADRHPGRINPTAELPRRFPRGRMETFYMIEDIQERQPLPVSKVRASGPGSYRMARIRPEVAARPLGGESWHIASHVREERRGSRQLVVYCGRDVEMEKALMRPLNGAIGVCVECGDIRALRPAANVLNRSG